MGASRIPHFLSGHTILLDSVLGQQGFLVQYWGCMSFWECLDHARATFLFGRVFSSRLFLGMGDGRLFAGVFMPVFGVSVVSHFSGVYVSWMRDRKVIFAIGDAILLFCQRTSLCCVTCQVIFFWSITGD